MLNIKLIAIAALGTFLSGSISGIWIANKWHNYTAMRAAIQSLKEANKRYRDAVGVSKDIDVETGNIELDNETVLAAINKKIEDELAKRRPSHDCNPQPSPMPKPVESLDVCIPAGVLRAIGELK